MEQDLRLLKPADTATSPWPLRHSPSSRATRSPSGLGGGEVSCDLSSYLSFPEALFLSLRDLAEQKEGEGPCQPLPLTSCQGIGHPPA